MASPVDTRLLELLRTRMDVVSDREHYARDPAGHLERLRRADADLREMVGSLPPNTHPELRHFLERQSYAKAVDWLQAHSGS